MQARFAIKQLSTAAVLAALLAAQGACAQQAVANTKPPVAAVTAVKPLAKAASTAKHAEEKEQPPQPGKPGDEGIEVHGHWVIDVKSPDGRLVAHREFENALVTRPGGLLSGDQLLAGLLSGNLTAGDPGIGLLQGTTGADLTEACNTVVPLDGGNVIPSSTCFGVTTSASGMASYLANFATGLTSTVTFSPSVSWVLSGNYTVPSTLTSISGVQTLVATCFKSSLLGIFLGSTSSTRIADFAASACIEAAYPPGPSFTNSIGPGAPGDYLDFVTFTSTNLSTPLSVSTGQVVTVTATISFS